jgi:hypothetical protein
MILEISTKKINTFVRIRDGTIEDELGLQERDRRRASIVGIWEFIATNSEAHSIGLAFEQAIVADKVAIGVFFILWHLGAVDKIDSISTNDAVVEPL